MKKIRFLKLLTISLSLILVFMLGFGLKTKAYYDHNSSYLTVYINGEIRFSANFDELANYMDGNQLNENGWPSKWMTNEWTKNMTFDLATFDKNGEDVCNSYGEFYDRWLSAFSFSGVEGGFVTSIYLWFYDTSSTSNYSIIIFSYTSPTASYENINYIWNSANILYYSDFPDAFYNKATTNYDSTIGGKWYYCGERVDTEIDSSFELKIEGGKTYRFDYYLSQSLDDIYESNLNSMIIPSVLYPDETSIRLPKMIDTGYYSLVWDIDQGTGFVELVDTESTDDFILLRRIQDLSSSVTVKLTASLIYSNGITYSRQFDIVVKEKGMQLATPVLEKRVDSSHGITYLQWASIPNAEYYELFSIVNGKYELMAILTSPTTSYRLPGGITDLGLYDFVLRANTSKTDYYKPSNYSNKQIYLFDTQVKKLDAPKLTINKNILSSQYNPYPSA